MKLCETKMIIFTFSDIDIFKYQFVQPMPTKSFRLAQLAQLARMQKLSPCCQSTTSFFLRRDICGIRFWPQPGCRLFPTASCLSNTKKHKNTNRRMQKICHKYKYTTKCKHKYTRTNTKLQSSCRLGPTASHLSKPTPVFFTTRCCAFKQ